MTKDLCQQHYYTLSVDQESGVDPKSLDVEKGMATYKAIGNEIKIHLPHCNIVSCVDCRREISGDERPYKCLETCLKT